MDACPYCFEKLKEAKSETAKVISVSKVGIPTLFHPNVPYYILLLQDGNGNIWAHKSVKEYKVGEEFAAEANPDKDAVSVWRIKYDPLEGIRKAVELLGGLKLGKDSKVLVLPSLAAPSHYYFRDNTSPEFLAGALDFLSEAGAAIENITIASQSFNETPIGACAQKSGLLKVCEKYGIAPVDLAAAAFEKCGQGGKFEIASAAKNADLVLNLPIMKIGQAEAVSNLFRILKKENYLALKYLESEKEITRCFGELAGKVINVGEGEFVKRPSGLTTYAGLVMASRNPMNLDIVFNEITMAGEKPEILHDIKAEDVPVAGRNIKEVQYRAEIY